MLKNDIGFILKEFIKDKKNMHCNVLNIRVYITKVKSTFSKLHAFII
jgi:hypothetical protein